MKITVLLFMKRGKRLIFIGGFPSKYRASVVYEGLEWDGSWKPILKDFCEQERQGPSVAAKAIL